MLGLITLTFCAMSAMDQYCGRFTRIGFDGRPRKPKWCPMNLSEEAHFSKRPQRSSRGPIAHFHGPPSAILESRDLATNDIAAAIREKDTFAAGLDGAGDDMEADYRRRKGRRKRPEYGKKDMVDLGPHYTKGQHFDMENGDRPVREHPLFMIDGKNKPRRFTGY